MDILCVEDDHIIAKPIIDELSAAFPEAEIKWIGTESEFYNSFEQIAENLPVIVTMDVMKLWAIPSANMPFPPAEVKRGGIHRAGIRCAIRLNNDERTRNIPIVLYTVLDEKDLEESLMKLNNCYYVSKEKPLSHLVEKVRELVGNKLAKL